MQYNARGLAEFFSIEIYMDMTNYRKEIQLSPNALNLGSALGRFGDHLGNLFLEMVSRDQHSVDVLNLVTKCMIGILEVSRDMAHGRESGQCA